MSKVSLQFTRGTDRRVCWGRKDEEYIADFILIARRTLTPEDYRVFNYHFLLGAGWKLCTRKLKVDRGNFYHAVYRVQQRLGRAYRETKPYGLFPVNEYFATTLNTAEPVTMPRRMPAGGGPVRPPILRAA